MLFDLSDSSSVQVVENFIRAARGEGQLIGLTSGCFDLIHFQHFNFFTRCRRNCGCLVVGVDSDEVVRADKGPTRPTIPDFQRVIMVGGLRSVSFSFIMNGIEDFGRVAKLIMPDIIFKNDAFKGKEDEVIGKEYAKHIMIIEDQANHNSTTDIIRHLSSRTPAESPPLAANS